MSSHIRFKEDISDYDATDSDEDYTTNEKILLNKVRNKKSDDLDSEVEVFGVGGEASEENESDIALSDIEDLQEDDLPDVQAWGSNKKAFYFTDYVDKDYGTVQDKDVKLAEREEEEAITIRQLLLQRGDKDEDVFKMDVKKHHKDPDKVSEELEKLSKISKSQILQESTDIIELIEDFKDKMKLAKDYLNPVLQKYKKGQIPDCPLVDFIATFYELILNCNTNFHFYLLLQVSGASVQNHPVIKRLYEYNHLLAQLEPIYEKLFKPHIKTLLQEDDIEKRIDSNKILQKLIKGFGKRVDKIKASQSPEDQRNAKRLRFIDEETESSKDIIENKGQDGENAENVSTRRAITYEIAKNKGLTPYRKKEQRNPRVKNRNKYRKAKIRRRGAVREPRTEITRYGGEISGIKATVTKSIKFKT